MNKITEFLKEYFSLKNIGIMFLCSILLLIIKILVYSFSFDVSIKEVFATKENYDQYDIYFMPINLAIFYWRYKETSKIVEEKFSQSE
jgi:hypothetical protein